MKDEQKDQQSPITQAKGHRLQQAWHRLHVVTLRGGEDHTAYVDDYDNAKSEVIAAVLAQHEQERRVDVQGIAAIAWRCIRECKDYEGPPVMCPAHQEEARALVEQERRWQPIATAPKDGTHVLACWAPYHPETCHDIDRTYWWDGRWRDPDEPEHFYSPPTHWMPLPDPPEMKTDHGAGLIHHVASPLVETEPASEPVTATGAIYETRNY